MFIVPMFSDVFARFGGELPEVALEGDFQPNYQKKKLKGFVHCFLSIPYSF